MVNESLGEDLQQSAKLAKSAEEVSRQLTGIPNCAQVFETRAASL